MAIWRLHAAGLLSSSELSGLLLRLEKGAARRSGSRTSKNVDDPAQLGTLLLSPARPIWELVCVPYRLTVKKASPSGTKPGRMLYLHLGDDWVQKL
jgi:hypothetical protein